MKRRLNILVVGPGVPRPDTSAGDKRLFIMLQMLAKSHRVDFYASGDQSPKNRARYRDMLQGIGVRILPQTGRGIEKAALRRMYDVGIFEFWWCAESYAHILCSEQPWAKIAVDTVDVHFLREEAGLAVGALDHQDFEEKMRRELDAYRRADAVIVVTEEDKQALEDCEMSSQQFLVPVIYNQRKRPVLQREHELLFVGGFNHLPNLDGILWFAKEMWPTIKRDVPDAVLTIVGSNPPSEVLALSQLDGVEVPGYVPDTDIYVDQAMLSIAPLRFGAGMKGKVVEAMASGLAVVTTSIGAQGLGAVSETHLIIADEAEQFALQTIRLLNNPDRVTRIGNAGQEHVAELCGFEAVERRLEEIVESVASSARPRVPPLKWCLRSLFFHSKALVKKIIRFKNLETLR